MTATVTVTPHAVTVTVTVTMMHPEHFATTNVQVVPRLMARHQKLRPFVFPLSHTGTT